MFLPSFSRLDIATRCVYPWQGQVRWPRRKEGKFATFGTAVGRVAECMAVWGDAPLEEIAAEAELPEADRKRLHLVSLELRALLAEETPYTTWRKAEVALAYDVRTGEGRELPSAGPRDYSKQRDSELSGTPDLVVCYNSGSLRIRDYKTGRYKWGHQPEHTPQLRALGLAAARAYGASEVVVELVQVDDDEIRHKQGMLGPFDLALAASELRSIYDRICGRVEPPKPGYWCAASFCPIAAVCPATQKALAAVAAASELRFPLSVEISSNEHAAYTLERLAAAEAAIESIREAVKSFARVEPVKLGNGKLYGPVLHDGRESFDLSVQGALEAIERHLGPKAATEAVEKRTNKAALEAAAKATQEKRGEGIGKVRELYEELRKIGALRKGSPYEKFSEWTEAGSEG